MADVKISQLPAASTPLDGTELVPIVQSGATDRVTVADLTAGRAIAALSATISGSTAGDMVRITQTGAGNALLVEDSANPDSTPFVIDANGNVGIGTATPTEPLTVSVSTSTSAVRITQNGTGNALLIEDSSSPDSTPLVVDNAGLVVQGTTTAQLGLIAASTLAPRFQQHATSSAAEATVGLFGWSVNPYITFSRSESSTVGTQTALTDGLNIGIIQANGSDGTVYRQSSRVTFTVDGTVASGTVPGRITFSTAAQGSSSVTERVRIDSAGRTDLRATMNPTGVGSASSISGTTLTVGGTVTGEFKVGDRVIGNGVEPNTFITALGTGTGGAGTYTVSNSQTVPSSGTITVRAIGGGLNVLRFTDTDTAVDVTQPIGVIEWYGSDSSTPGAGVKAYIAGVNESGTPDSALVFGTSDNVADTQAVERMRIDSNGFTTLKGSLGRGAPVTKTGNFTVAVTENWIICNGTGSITVTLPTASAWTGREIMIKTIAAQTVVSNASNVVPLTGGAAGTAILAATAGKWATLVSDGTNWIIMAAA